MGNSQSNSINGEINKILQETPDTTSTKNESPLDIKFNDDSKPVAKYVSAETDDRRSMTRGNRRSMRRMSPTSSAHMDLGELNVKCTYSVTSPDGALHVGNMGGPVNSATSSASVPHGVEHSVTSEMTTSPTSSEPLPAGVVNSATSTDLNKSFQPRKKLIQIDSSIFESSESSPKVGGYTYASEVSEPNAAFEPAASVEPMASKAVYHGGNKVVKLDPSVFQSSEDHVEPSNVAVQKKSDFDPEKFFKEMQSGGLYEPKNKERKMGKIEKYLTPEDDEDEGFDFAASTEGLDLDENEDTEDLKAKVKHLRMMVSRSKGKKSSKSSKKSHRKAKRATESSGGASESGSYESGSYESGSNESGSNESGSYETATSEGRSNGSATENSVSEYLDTTSSISTSDVRLISMNKMRK